MPSKEGCVVRIFESLWITLFAFCSFLTRCVDSNNCEDLRQRISASDIFDWILVDLLLGSGSSWILFLIFSDPFLDLLGVCLRESKPFLTGIVDQDHISFSPAAGVFHGKTSCLAALAFL